MQSSGIPKKFATPWAASANAPYIRAIPTESQVNVTDGAASLADGFPALNFQKIGAGGIPPSGADMNGILKWVTQWAQWQSAGGPIGYDANFAAAIQGYPRGATLASKTLGNYWLNNVEGNISDPDAGGEGWRAFSTVTAENGISAGDGVAVAPSTAVFAGSISGTTLTVSNIASGHVAAGMSIMDESGAIIPGTEIIGLGTGSGGVGTYIISMSQSVSARTINATSKSIGLGFQNLDPASALAQSDALALYQAAAGASPARHRKASLADLYNYLRPLFGVNHDSTLTGDGTAQSPLGVGAPVRAWAIWRNNAIASARGISAITRLYSGIYRVDFSAPISGSYGVIGGALHAGNGPYYAGLGAWLSHIYDDQDTADHCSVCCWALGGDHVPWPSDGSDFAFAIVGGN